MEPRCHSDLSFPCNQAGFADIARHGPVPAKNPGPPSHTKGLGLRLLLEWAGSPCLTALAVWVALPGMVSPGMWVPPLASLSHVTFFSWQLTPQPLSVSLHGTDCLCIFT